MEAVTSSTPHSDRRGGGCCKFGGSCGDCGNDVSGWCHQSSANCGACTGVFDSRAAAPQCGGSAPSPTPLRPSPVARPTPPTSSGGGCCKFGGSCGDCGNDGSGWCHQSSANCGAAASSEGLAAIAVMTAQAGAISLPQTVACAQVSSTRVQRLRHAAAEADDVAVGPWNHIKSFFSLLLSNFSEQTTDPSIDDMVQSRSRDAHLERRS
eukprot:TRINITY_DN6160_c0_g1_i6.p1 TRINITY_DN6160_c0_g1~~TRINITY_DN6160_c0_g1_i6.p1  ORF type:complete len:209 (+),score=9.07 TRINITY_DN6160_c0_g1_i6:75-701(+)